MNLSNTTIDLDVATSDLARVLKKLALPEKRAVVLIGAISRLAAAHRRHALAEIVAAATAARGR